MFSEDSNNFLNNGSVGIHAVSADGIIVYANQCELETLGYTMEEYVGHHTDEFQIDVQNTEKNVNIGLRVTKEGMNTQ